MRAYLRSTVSVFTPVISSPQDKREDESVCCNASRNAHVLTLRVPHVPSGQRMAGQVLPAAQGNIRQKMADLMLNTHSEVVQSAVPPIRRSSPGLCIC